MADPIDLRVCVLAPRFDELAQFPAHLQDLLARCSGVYDTTIRDKVYGDSRDVWRPFDSKKSIADYITEAGFRLNSVSGQLQAPIAAANLQTLLREVDLYVIDPLLLSLADFDQTIRRIEAAISGDATESKRFAVLIPKHLPPELQLMMEVLARALVLLENAYRQSGEDLWPGEDPSRLEAFLRRLQKRMAFDQLAAGLLGARTTNLTRPMLLGGH